MAIRVTQEMKQVIKYNSDNPWLGGVYVNFPPARLTNRRAPRIHAVTHEYGQFQFVNQRMIWTLKSDPAYSSLRSAALHQKVHKNSGWVRNQLPLHLQSSPIDYDFQLQLNNSAVSERAPHPSSYWRCSLSEQRQRDWSDPKVHAPQTVDDDSMSAPSEISVVSRSRFQDVLAGFVVDQDRR